MLKPLITEKTTKLAKDLNKYTFLVDVHLDKNQIKKIIEKTFGVTVKSVETILMPGKSKRFGKARRQVLSQEFKKAQVSLPEKEKISLFEIEEKGKKK